MGDDSPFSITKIFSYRGSRPEVNFTITPFTSVSTDIKIEGHNRVSISSIVF